MPSVLLAEASWYGSLRGGVNFGGGEDARFADGYSRFGIQGSAEASEGLTAVYRFEHAISTEDGTLSYPRLAYIGLSGGFGNLTVGQIWSASYNHAGVIVDKSNYYGAHETSGRHGNAVSYAFSSGAVSFQADLVADDGMDTGGSVDKAEFGLTVALGDIGKVAFAHTNMKNTQKMVAAAPIPGTGSPAQSAKYRVIVTAASGDTPAVLGADAKMITVTVAKSNNEVLSGTDNASTSRKLLAGGLDDITYTDGKYAIGTCGVFTGDNVGNDACIKVNAFVSSTTTRVAGDNVPTQTIESFHLVGTAATNVKKTADAQDEVLPTIKPAHMVVDVPGHKTSHIGFEFNLGGVTAHLAHTQKKVNGTNAKSKTNHFGVTGTMGDSGVSIVALARAKKDGMGGSTNPWVLGFSKSLGGGAKAYFEHGNNDDGESGNSRLGLIVSF